MTLIFMPMSNNGRKKIDSSVHLWFIVMNVIRLPSRQWMNRSVFVVHRLKITPNSSCLSDIWHDQGQCIPCYRSWQCTPGYRWLQSQVSVQFCMQINSPSSMSISDFQYVHLGWSMSCLCVRRWRLMSPDWGRFWTIPMSFVCTWKATLSLWKKSWSIWRRTMRLWATLVISSQH